MPRQLPVSGALGMDISKPANYLVLKYLGSASPLVEPPDAVAYWQRGCHPDVVERVWDRIGKALPADCRCLVRGTPALVHPQSGVILAIGMGTAYGLRLPSALYGLAVQAGAKTQTVWSGGGRMDIQLELGPDWVFGAWLAEELDWCREAYEILGGDRPE